MKLPLDHVICIKVNKQVCGQHKLLLKGYSSQGEVHNINLHMYTVLVVPTNCAQRSLINN